MNMKSNKQYADSLWKCDDCMSMDPSLTYSGAMREGKNLSSDLDLVHYYQSVTKIREDNTT